MAFLCKVQLECLHHTYIGATNNSLNRASQENIDLLSLIIKIITLFSFSFSFLYPQTLVQTKCTIRNMRFI